MEKRLELSRLMDFYAPLLTDRQREFLEMYVLDDFSLQEIAEQEGISRQGVRDALMRGEKTLAEIEDKIGLADKIFEFEGQLEAFVEKIREFGNADLAEELRDILKNWRD